jgi:hypothetical protein
MHRLPILLKLHTKIYRLIKQMQKNNNSLKDNKEMRIYFNINSIDRSVLKTIKQYLIKYFNQ